MDVGPFMDHCLVMAKGFEYKYVRDDKNLPSMGSGGNKKIHNAGGAGRGAVGGICEGFANPSPGHGGRVI